MEEEQNRKQVVRKFWEQRDFGNYKVILDNEVDSRAHAELEVERLQAELRDCQAEAKQWETMWGIMHTERDTALTLAELVTPELPVLLEWLSDRTTQVILETACAYGLDHPLVMQQNMQVKAARELATCIRELQKKGKEIK